MSDFVRFLNMLLFAVTLVVLTACGGSSGGGAEQTGQVSVVITDGPTDIYERVLITLSSMTLIGSGGHQVIYEGEPITFDLLQLRDRADFAFSQRITVGDYNKIRLEVTEVRLVDLDDATDPNGDGVPVEDLPANGKIDLNPQGPFTVVADRATVVELDIDALRSFQVVQTGNEKLRFRPVIFVNVYNDEIVLPNRLTRVFGTVEGVDEVEESLLLCDLQFVAQLGGTTASDPSNCVRVFAGGANHFGADGLAFADFAALADAIEAAAPAQVTAIGHASLPDSIVDNVVMELDAVVTELGPRKLDLNNGWETTAGAILTDLTTTDCAASQCVDFQPTAADTALTVQLQPETRVFMRNGTELVQTDLGTGVNGAFDGLRVDEGGIEEMRASLFVTGPNAASDPVLVAGTLTAVTLGDPDILTVQLEDTTTVSVCVTADSDVLQILVEDGTTTIVDLLDPAVLDPADGLQVEAAGEPGDGAPCDLDASVVIVE